MINIDKLRKAHKLCRVLLNPTCQKIFTTIEKERVTTVSEIQEKTGIDQPIISQHIGKLKEVGVLNAVRHNKYIFYSIRKARIEKINNALIRFNSKQPVEWELS